ncbi:MAG: minor capsid protein [Burkholderiales bacterium]
MPEASSTASGVPEPVAAEFERWLEEFGMEYERALERFVRGKRKDDAVEFTADPARLRDYDAIGERLDLIDSESMGELADALLEARDEFLAFVRRALRDSPQSPEWVNALEFDPGAQFSAAVERMFHRAWEYARDLLFERAYADPPSLGRLPESAQRYFRTKRFWVAGLVSKDATRQAQAIILAGMKSGASADTIAARLGEALDEFSGARLRTIVRTNVTDAYNQGVLVDMRSDDMRGIVKAVEYVAILDDRTTEVCQYLDGTVFRLDDSRLDALNPPNHFNCRSVLSPVVEGQRVPRSKYITGTKFRKAQRLIPPGFGGTK